MKGGIAPVVAAGGAFAVTTLAGLLVGFWLTERTNVQMWTAGGLFAGLLVGGYSAYRLLMRSL